jgi:hypothetical protein
MKRAGQESAEGVGAPVCGNQEIQSHAGPAISKNSSPERLSRRESDYRASVL